MSIKSRRPKYDHEDHVAQLAAMAAQEAARCCESQDQRGRIDPQAARGRAMEIMELGATIVRMAAEMQRANDRQEEWIESLLAEHGLAFIHPLEVDDQNCAAMCGHGVETIEPMTKDIERRTWEEFGGAGLLGFANMVLHAFGWCIVASVDDDGRVTEAYPARTRWRGFSAKTSAEVYERVTEWMAKAGPALRKEIEE
jgi:hypothetical protein